MEECGLSERITAQPESNIRHNCRIKRYPDGSAVLLLSDRAIFRAPGWEEVNPKKRKDVGALLSELSDSYDVAELSQYELARLEEREAASAAASLARAQRRAKAAVRDLGLCNDWRFFVTLTLDAAKVDRYDVAAITRRLNTWLDNHVRRDGLAYVLVPERHKDGAIHFHGFFNGALRAVDSGTIDRGKGKPQRPRSAKQRADWIAAGGRIVYNLPAWDFGFTTAIELYGNRRAAVGYVSKYIAKQMQPDGTPGKIGGRWYYSGGALRRPGVEYCDVDMEAYAGYDGFEFVIDALGAKCKIIDVEGAAE